MFRVLARTVGSADSAGGFGGARMSAERCDLAWTISRLKASVDQDLRQRQSLDSKRGMGMRLHIESW
jgi:hypothetical protein